MDSFNVYFIVCLIWLAAAIVSNSLSTWAIFAFNLIMLLITFWGDMNE